MFTLHSDFEGKWKDVDDEQNVGRQQVSQVSDTVTKIQTIL